MKFNLYSKGNKMKKFLTLLIFVILIVPTLAFSSPKKLVNDNDYSDKDFRKCNITDYSNMVDGDDVNWVWIDPTVKLAGYKFEEGKVENKSELRSRLMLETVTKVFKDIFSDIDAKGEKGILTADICIFEAENFNANKVWIPFAGAYQMQAGIGVEMILCDSKNIVIGKFRHSGRKGMLIENATQEVAGDLMKYIGNH